MNTSNGVAVLAALMIIVTVAGVIDYATLDQQIITVQDKYMYVGVESSTGSDGDSWVTTTKNFIVVSVNGMTYKVGYPLWMLFNSKQSLYGRIKIGDTYVIKIVGFRIDWLSWYPRIYEIELEDTYIEVANK